MLQHSKQDLVKGSKKEKEKLTNPPSRKENKRASKLGFAKGSKRAKEGQLPLFIVLVTISNIVTWGLVSLTHFFIAAGYRISPNIVHNIIGVAMPMNALLNPCFYTLRTEEFRTSIMNLFPF